MTMKLHFSRFFYTFPGYPSPIPGILYWASHPRWFPGGSLLETMAGEGIRHRAPGLGEGVTPGIPLSRKKCGVTGVTGVTHNGILNIILL